jgi:RNA polymerase subunit RPABC4/transcription elongation factor Spt4
MFFFIGGVQPKTVTLTKVTRVCTVCGHPEISQKRVDHYLSLFFIPLFPVKKGSPFWVCGNCETVYDDSGTPLSSQQPDGRKTCPHCGRSVFSDYTFCPYCGKTL